MYEQKIPRCALKHHRNNNKSVLNIITSETKLYTNQFLITDHKCKVSLISRVASAGRNKRLFNQNEQTHAVQVTSDRRCIGKHFREF